MQLLENKTRNEIVTEIHDAFYSAGDRLLDEAKALLANPQYEKDRRAERLKRLGFGVSKPCKEAANLVQARSAAQNNIKIVEYYRVYYPNHKFITEAQVKSLCEKYGLLMGDCGQYQGDIPEANIEVIENFKLRKEDWTAKENYFNSFALIQQYIGLISDPFGQSGNFGIMNSEPIGRGRASSFADYLREAPSYFHSPYSDGQATKKKEEPKPVETEQKAFKICAPKEDFNTSGYEVREGFRLVLDPVVLQPVKDGFLIVTAWGKEGEDELVINQAQN